MARQKKKKVQLSKYVDEAVFNALAEYADTHEDGNMTQALNKLLKEALKVKK